MTARNPSASSFFRLAHCLPSHFLPIAGDSGNEWSDRGNVGHEFAHRADEIGRDAALAEISDDNPHKAALAAIPVELLPRGGEREVAYAYDPDTDTARIIGYNIGRAYRENGAKPHEICGTADIVGVVGEFLSVPDLKFGYADLGPAFQSKQLRLLVLFACRAHGFTKAKSNFVFSRDGNVYESVVAEFDEFDLDAIAAEVREKLAELREAEARAAAGEIPDTRAGTWCKHCECKASCPTRTGIVKASIGAEPLANLTPDKATEAWTIFDMLEDWIEKGRAELREYAKTTPFAVLGGKVVREVAGEEKELASEVVREVVCDLYGATAAGKVVATKTSQAALERVIKEHANGKAVAPIKRAAMIEIEKRGGITKVPTSTVKAVKDPAAPPVMVVKVEAEGGRMVPRVLVGGGES